MSIGRALTIPPGKERSNMGGVRAGIVCVVVLGLCACGGFAPLRCSAQERAVVNDTLYFGTAMPDGVVALDQWNEFLGSVVTPRFPLGLSEWPAAGQWQSADGRIIHEVSHVLVLVHPEDAGSDLAVRSIVDAYKTRFSQEAVLRVRSAACALP